MDDDMQGLRPIVDALRSAGIPAKVEQVGGGTLAVNVYIRVDHTHSEFVAIMTGDEEETWGAYYYADDDFDGKALGHTLTTAQLVTLMQGLNIEKEKEA